MSNGGRRGLLGSILSEDNTSSQLEDSKRELDNEQDENEDSKREPSEQSVLDSTSEQEESLSEQEDSTSESPKAAGEGLLGMIGGSGDRGSESIESESRRESDGAFSDEGSLLRGESSSSEDNAGGLLSNLTGGRAREEKVSSWFREEEERAREERREREEAAQANRDSSRVVEEEGGSGKSELSERGVQENLDAEESLDVIESRDVASQDDDLLMGMLESFDDSSEVEIAKKRMDLDEDVVVPLEREGMEDIIVTPDGRSLAEMIPSLRKGRGTTTKKMYDLIKSQEDVREIGEKKFSDSRYAKHVDKIEKESNDDRKREKLSLKYYQRNAEFSEQEKTMMKNLGLSGDEFSKVMKSKELTREEKKEVVALGRYGPEKHFKGKRYRTTVGDMAILEFLTKFKFANTRILRWLRDESQSRTWRKMNRLRDSGLVESQTILGISDLWGATSVGVGLTGYGYEPGLRPLPKIPTISSNMGVNYLAACLWFNTVNVLNLEDFPANNRKIPAREDGSTRTRGEMLVSEYEIRSSLGKEINPNSTTLQTLGDERLYDVIADNVRSEFDRWELSGRVGESPEFALGNEYMWVLYPTSQLTLSYHVPDLVVQRERGPNGEPRSIAVEVERHEKSSARYDQILLAYKLDEHLYEKVVWVTPNMRTARALEKAAKDVGFERYSILPIITKDGVYNKPDVWMI